MPAHCAKWKRSWDSEWNASPSECCELRLAPKPGKSSSGCIAARTKVLSSSARKKLKQEHGFLPKQFLAGSRKSRPISRRRLFAFGGIYSSDPAILSHPCVEIHRITLE